LLNAVSQWTNEKKFPVNQLLARLTRRCDELGLHVPNDDPQQDFRVTAFITTLVMNYLFTGIFKRTKLSVVIVILSEALQRNAKHEARLSNISECGLAVAKQRI
jgi:hypothetical protein